YFFFQAEDGIRDFHGTGVQTCALPISPRREKHCTEQVSRAAAAPSPQHTAPAREQASAPSTSAGRRQTPTPRTRPHALHDAVDEIGRASWRERGKTPEVVVSVEREPDA